MYRSVQEFRYIWGKAPKFEGMCNKKLFPGEEVEPHRTTSMHDNGSHNATFFEAVTAANCEAQCICTVCGNRLPEMRASRRMHAYAAPKKNPVLQTGGLWMMRYHGRMCLLMLRCLQLLHGHTVNFKLMVPEAS